MSASREKKKRQELIANNGGVDPKTAREAQQKSAERKSKILYTTLAVAFVVVAVFLVVYNSGILQRSRTAVIIDGEKYTAADVSYYYGNAYQNFLAQYGSYVSLFGLDPNQSLKSQNAFGGEDQTWDEYFKEQAVMNMRFTAAVKKTAQEKNVTLDEEDLAAFDEAVAAFKEQASKNGFSYKAYLSAIYGSVMTPEVYERNLKDGLLVSKVANDYHESLSFTDEEVQAYYEENKNTYDLVDGEYVMISGSAPSTTDAEGNTVAATDEEKAAAMEEAKEKAQKLLDDYKAGKKLEDLAAEYEGVYTGNTEMTYSAGASGDWLFDESRKAGDVEIVEDADNSRYFVITFHSRKQDDALDYSVRHILVTDANLELPEGAESTDELRYNKAEEILNSWDGTEEGFAELAKEHSQDGSSSNGGLYEGVLKHQMVSEFEGWCYADGRKAGDTGIVKSTYGQHIMYFVGYGETPYWYSACENKLISDAYTQWQDSMTESVTAETQSGMNSVG